MPHFLKTLFAAWLCCLSTAATAGVMLVDFEMADGASAKSAIKGGAAPSAADSDSDSSGNDSAAGSDSSSGGSSSQRSGSGSASGSGGGSGGGGATSFSPNPTNNMGGGSNGTGGSSHPVGAIGGTGGDVGPGFDSFPTDPIALVSAPNDSPDVGPSIANDPNFSYVPPLLFADNSYPMYPIPALVAEDEAELSAMVEGEALAASAPEASAVFVWGILSTAAVVGYRVRRQLAC